jgi:hypothetical protein
VITQHHGIKELQKLITYLPQLHVDNHHRRAGSVRVNFALTVLAEWMSANQRRAEARQILGGQWQIL